MHTVKENNRTIVFTIIMLSVLLTQNGILGNLPVLLLLVPIFFYGRGKILLYKSRSLKLLLAYWCYLTLVTFIHIGSNYDIKNSVFIIVEYLVLFLGCYIVVPHINITLFFIYLRNIGIVVALLGIVEVIIGVPFLGLLLNNVAYDGNVEYRMISIFGHPIVCSLFLVAFWVLLLLYPMKSTYWNILFNVIIIISIGLTRSRSAWLAALIMYCMYYLKFKKLGKLKIKKKAVIFVMLLFVFAIFASFVKRTNPFEIVFEYIASRLIGTFNAGEGQIIRIETVLNSISYWKNGNIGKAILGMGKNYDKIFMSSHPIIKWGAVIWDSCLDNQYFTIIHESGLIGLLLILSIFIVNFMSFLKTNKQETNIIASTLIANVIFVMLYFFEGLNYIVVDILLVLVLSVVAYSKFQTVKSKMRTSCEFNSQSQKY